MSGHSPITLHVPDTAAMQPAWSALAKQANDLVIDSPESVEEFGNVDRELTAGIAAVTAVFEPMRKLADTTKTEILKVRNCLTAPLRRAKGALRDRHVTYEAEQSRLRLAEESRLREIARKEAEEKQFAEAARLDQQGHAEAAEQVLQAPVQAPAVVLPAAPKAKGVSTSTTWKARVTNATVVPRAFCKPDQVLLDAQARSLERAMNIPGVEAYPETHSVVRG